MDEQPVPPQPNEDYVVGPAEVSVTELQHELTELKQTVAQLTASLQATHSQPQASDRLAQSHIFWKVTQPSREEIVHYDVNMTFDTFVTATHGKDVNHCWINKKPLAFFITDYMPSSVRSSHSSGVENYYAVMTYMLSHGLQPNMRWKRRSLLRATDDALSNAKADLVRYKTTSDRYGCKNHHSTEFAIERRIYCCTEICNKLRKLGAQM